ncbi:MAG: hypothetical protein JO340_04120, partial [Acidobacteriaceae bacterium]|nr:hypothetical protein [Acidobacteriaceae bacterium]
MIVLCVAAAVGREAAVGFGMASTVTAALPALPANLALELVVERGDVAGSNEVVTKLSSEGFRKAQLLALTHSGFGIVVVAAKLYEARRWASVTLVAPSTFVMRFRLYAIVARPISTLAPDNPRISKRGCPKIRYLIV